MSIYKKSLLIDDEPSVNFINKKLLLKYNIVEKVVDRLNGKEALDYILSEKIELLPDIVFLDINMPVMDGWEFLDVFVNDISEEIKNRVTIIVMLTTSLNPVNEEKIKKYTLLKSYIKKPLTLETLKKILNIDKVENELINKNYSYLKTFKLKDIPEKFHSELKHKLCNLNTYKFKANEINELNQWFSINDVKPEELIIIID